LLKNPLFELLVRKPSLAEDDSIAVCYADDSDQRGGQKSQ
jgi:hypothetical protein